MKPRTIAVVSGGACALIGPAVARAFTDDPFDQAVLSLMIAGSVVVAMLIGVRRS